MNDDPRKAFLICACWLDQRYPGTRLSKLYAARTPDIESALSLVRDMRPAGDKVKATGEMCSEEMTRRLGVGVGQVVAATPSRCD